jgi:arylsulfatase
MPRPFTGTIDLDIRKSKPDWDAFLDTRAPNDAPNVLVILYDECAPCRASRGRSA